VPNALGSRVRAPARKKSAPRNDSDKDSALLARRARLAPEDDLFALLAGEMNGRLFAAERPLPPGDLLAAGVRHTLGWVDLVGPVEVGAEDDERDGNWARGAWINWPCQSEAICKARQLCEVGQGRRRTRAGARRLDGRPDRTQFGELMLHGRDHRDLKAWTGAGSACLATGLGLGRRRTAIEIRADHIGTVMNSLATFAHRRTVRP
jgi:hypothetical protein